MKKRSVRLNKRTLTGPILYQDETDWVQLADVVWKKLRKHRLRSFLEEFDDAEDLSIFLRRYVKDAQLISLIETEFGQGVIFGIAWRSLQQEHIDMRLKAAEEGEDEDVEEEI